MKNIRERFIGKGITNLAEVDKFMKELGFFSEYDDAEDRKNSYRMIEESEELWYTLNTLEASNEEERIIFIVEVDEVNEDGEVDFYIKSILTENEYWGFTK